MQLDISYGMMKYHHMVCSEIMARNTDKRSRVYYAVKGAPTLHMLRETDPHEATLHGLPYSAYTELADRSGLGRQEFAHKLRLPLSTLARRARSGTLSIEESDKLVRYVQVLDSAVSLFDGDEEEAVHWLNNPVKALGGRTPIEMLSTHAGTTAVLDVIGRLEHGVFS